MGDLILTIFYERQIKQSMLLPFGELLRQQVSGYIEAQFRHYYPGMINFVQKHELHKANNPVSQADTSAASAAGNDPAMRAEVEEIARDFERTWKSHMASLHTAVMNSFANFNNGLEILKQSLTQLLLYYTRFQKCLHKLNLLKLVQDQIVPNATILQEIKVYSRSF